MSGRWTKKHAEAGAGQVVELGPDPCVDPRLRQQMHQQDRRQQLDRQVQIDHARLGRENPVREDRAAAPQAPDLQHQQRQAERGQWPPPQAHQRQGAPAMVGEAHPDEVSGEEVDQRLADLLVMGRPVRERRQHQQRRNQPVAARVAIDEQQHMPPEDGDHRDEPERDLLVGRQRQRLGHPPEDAAEIGRPAVGEDPLSAQVLKGDDRQRDHQVGDDHVPELAAQVVGVGEPGGQVLKQEAGHEQEQHRPVPSDRVDQPLGQRRWDRPGQQIHHVGHHHGDDRHRTEAVNLAEKRSIRRAFALHRAGHGRANGRAATSRARSRPDPAP